MSNRIETARAVRDKVMEGVQRAVQSEGNDLKVQDAGSVAANVTQAVLPVVMNATNSEPWYQSRVTLGSIATIISSAFALYAMLSAGITDGEILAPPIGALAGAAFALYGRWKARKPIGS